MPGDAAAPHGTDAITKIRYLWLIIYLIIHAANDRGFMSKIYLKTVY